MDSRHNYKFPGTERRTPRRQADRDIVDFFSNANIGMHWIGPDGIILWANRYEVNWLGYTPEEYIGRHISDFHADKKKAASLLERLHENEVIDDEEVELIKKDGTTCFGLISSSVFWENGKFIHTRSFTKDITDRKLAESALKESERRFHMVADTAPVMIWTAGPDKKRDYFNRFWLEFTGKKFEDEVGFGWLNTIHSDDRDRVLKTYSDFFDTRRPFRMEYRLRRHDNHYRWVLSQGVPRFAANGAFMGYIGSVIDIHDRKQFENRMGFLAQASSMLYASLDYETTLQSLADLMVPSFADWCTVNLLESNDIRTTAIAHRDPEKIAWVKKFQDRYKPELNAPYGIGKVIRSGQPELIQEIPEHLLVSAAKDREHLELLRSLNMTSAIMVPLKVQGKTLGAVAFILAESNRKYLPEDLAFAEEVAHNAATAIENARLYKRMQESDNAKTQFLSMLAHELRNPMAPILSSLDLLQFHARENPELKETLDLMNRQVRQMSRLLDDLLDVSRIIHGKIKLAKKDFDLNTVIQYAIETTRPLKEEFNHTLSVSLPSRPVFLHADPVRLEQVVVNLLNNAYKYTEPRGTVWLTVTEQNNEAVIRVKDTGIGISPQMLPKIFDLFSQADNTLSRSYGGMGIGLTLVKSLVEMHDGAVSVESAGLGKGSEFIIRFPIQAAAPQPQARFGFESNGAPETAPVTRPAQRILIVDDNRDAAHALGRLLQRIGHQVEFAYDGPSAVNAARNYQPGIILLDIGLPEMNGYEVAQRIRENPLHKGVMLVAVSGYGQEEDKLRSQEAGFDYHFTKPIALDTLNQIL